MVPRTAGSPPWSLLVAATSGFQDLQGCRDSGRQDPHLPSSAGAQQGSPGLFLSVTLAVLRLPSLPFRLPITSALWSLLPGHSVNSVAAFQHILFLLKSATSCCLQLRIVQGVPRSRSKVFRGEFAKSAGCCQR